jgi:hypothetical protein
MKSEESIIHQLLQSIFVSKIPFLIKNLCLLLTQSDANTAYLMDKFPDHIDEIMSAVSRKNIFNPEIFWTFILSDEFINYYLEKNE